MEKLFLIKMEFNGIGRRVKGNIKSGFDYMDQDAPKGCIRPIIEMPNDLFDNEIII